MTSFIPQGPAPGERPSGEFLAAVMGEGPAPRARAPFPGRPSSSETEEVVDAVPEAYREAFSEFLNQRDKEAAVPRESHNAQMAKMRKRGDSMEKLLRDKDTEIARLKAASIPDAASIIKDVMADAVVTTEDGHRYMDPEKVTEGFAKAMELLQEKQTTASSVDVEAKIEEAFALRPLSSEQRDAVLEMRDHYPGLSVDKLVNLARMDNPDLFPDSARQNAFANAPGRGGSEERGAPDGDPGSREIADWMMSLPPDDPRAADAGAWLVKAEMDEKYPGIHGPGR